MNPTLRRELRVAFSPRGQPVWFRVIKWLVILTLAFFFWNRLWFWCLLGASAVAAVPVHLYYRRRTANWTRPWRGWNDVASVGPLPSSIDPPHSTSRPAAGDGGKDLC